MGRGWRRHEWSHPVDMKRQTNTAGGGIFRTTSRDGQRVGTGQISEAGVSSTTLLSFVLYSLLHAHEVPAHQG